MSIRDARWQSLRVGGHGGTLADAGARHVVSAKVVKTPSHDGLLVLKVHVPSGWTHLAVDADRAVVAQGYGNDEASSFAALRTVLDAKPRSPATPSDEGARTIGRQVHATHAMRLAAPSPANPRVHDDADLARRATRYLDPDRVLETQAAVYRPLLTSGPTGDPLRDFMPGLDRRVVESYAAGDLRTDKLPAVVSERLEALEQKIEKRSHRWKKGMLATALALTEHSPGATRARVA